MANEMQIEILFAPAENNNLLEYLFFYDSTAEAVDFDENKLA